MNRGIEGAIFFFGMATGFILFMVMSMHSGVGLVAKIDNSKVAKLVKDNGYVAYSETYFNHRLHSVRISLGQGDETRMIEGAAALKMVTEK